MGHVGEVVFRHFDGKGFDLAGPEGFDSRPDGGEGKPADPIEQTSHSEHVFLLFLFRRHRVGDAAGGVDGRLGGVDRAHDVGVGGGVQAEGPGDAGDLSGGEHQPQAQQGVVLEDHKARYQNGGLQEGRQAQADDLLDPLDEAIDVAPGDAEHIEAAHSDLDEQDAARFRLLKNTLITA